jgi:NAD(P)-dependent dehydrogenase (short-subunit alcohol dehydrogenase family)
MSEIRFDGRVAVITGAGRGIGREHALLFAREGARVVVNDRGGSVDGIGADAGPAHAVVEEIVGFGGEAVANTDDVADWEGGRNLVRSALDAFARLDVLVNNAGIVRDRTIANMSEDEWDSVVRVHLKGHFVPLRHAAAYWRDEAKAGRAVAASVVNTSSTSGLFGNPGQANYGAAKTAIATLTTIAQLELGRYGVRCNAIAPVAETRITASVPGAEDHWAERADLEWNPWDPANVSPFVAYLATADCPIKGRVFYVLGGTVGLFHPYAIVDRIETDRRWTIDELRAQAPRLADVPFDLGHPF